MSNRVEHPTPEEVETQIRLAMLCGRLNCELQGSDVWNRIPCKGGCPAPADLIVWAAAEAVRRAGALSA